MEIIRVGMADLKAARNPCMITTLGLGSCIGIALYDPITKISGLAHIMLPESSLIKNNLNLAKFADTAIDKLIEDMQILGAQRKTIWAKIAGGAQMFGYNSTQEIMQIGKRNAEATKKRLTELNIRLISEDCGGNYGRTVELYSDDGRFMIKTIGRGIKYI